MVSNTRTVYNLVNNGCIHKYTHIKQTQHENCVPRGQSSAKNMDDRYKIALTIVRRLVHANKVFKNIRQLTRKLNIRKISFFFFNYFFTIH